MKVQRGFRDKLEKYLNINNDINIEINISGISDCNYYCFATGEDNRISDYKYMIFNNQTSSPQSEIVFDLRKFKISLNKIPSTINKLVFAVNINNGNMSNISSYLLKISQDNNIPLEMNLSGYDFNSEKAIVAIEIYKKENIWRVAFLAKGFNGGFNELLKVYGGNEMNIPKPAPKSVNPAVNSVKKVELRKGQKVNLQKSGNALGEILINLNWNQPEPKKSFLKSLFSVSNAIDLDLGCLYEMKNGSKGCVQALGNAFGSLSNLPFIALDNDDRTGASVGGENLRVNGKMISQIKRILVYTFIYEGAANWREAQGTVTVKCPGSPEIVVKMDEYGSNLGTCAIAMFENCNDETFSVEKIVRFFRGHEEMDRAFNWGMRWVAGRK